MSYKAINNCRKTAIFAFKIWDYEDYESQKQVQDDDTLH